MPCFKDGTQEPMSLGNQVLGPTFAAFSNTSIAYKYTSCRDAKSEKGMQELRSSLGFVVMAMVAIYCTSGSS